MKRVLLLLHRRGTRSALLPIVVSGSCWVQACAPKEVPFPTTIGGGGQISWGGESVFLPDDVEEKDKESSAGGRPGIGGSDQVAEGGAPEEEQRNYLPCAVEILVAQRCRKCHSLHGIGQEPFLETWTQVSAEAEPILDVISDDFMPAIGLPLTDAQKEVLRSWVNDGTPAVRASAPPACELPAN